MKSQVVVEKKERSRNTSPPSIRGDYLQVRTHKPQTFWSRFPLKFEEVKLLPCPLCGSAANRVYDYAYSKFSIECTGKHCGLSLPADGYVDAKDNKIHLEWKYIQHWNERVSP
jgi:hypothetical protein